jgi:hypothetical protein
MARSACDDPPAYTSEEGGMRQFVTVVNLQVGVPNGGTVESIKPRVIDLARAIIAKLR